MEKETVRAEREIEATVFYDQNCGLCDQTIRYLIKKDLNRQLTFSPLQGQYAQEVLPASLSADLSTYVVLSDDQIMTRGKAVKFLIGNMRTLRKYMWILPLPMVLVDFMYSLIGRYRYQMFGHPEFCVHENSELRARFRE